MAENSVQKKDPDLFLYWFLIILRGYALCFLGFLRIDFGVNAIGMEAIGGIIAIFGFSTIWQVPMGAFLWPYIAALLFQKIKTSRNVRKGWQGHSRGWGVSWLAGRLPVSQQIQHMTIEPSIVCALGFGLLWMEIPMGEFFIFGALAMVIKASFEHGARTAQEFEMQDMEFELRDRFANFRR